MKLAIKMLALFFGVVLLVSGAKAELMFELLDQMVEQLQKSPADDALRDKIIKFAQENRPAPRVPDIAIKKEGQGQLRLKNAKSIQDYVDAAEEYEQAIKIAPWVEGYYSNLCAIYERAERYADAKRNCLVVLRTTGNPVLTADLNRRIAGLDESIEQESSPEKLLHLKALAAQQKFPSLIRMLEGAIFIDVEDSNPDRVGDKLYCLRKPPLNTDGVPDALPQYLYCQRTYKDNSGRINYFPPLVVKPLSDLQFKGRGVFYGNFTLSRDGQALIEDLGGNSPSVYRKER